MTDLFSLKNKVAIVTGGYGYLGSAMVEALSQYGATVIVAGRNIEKFNHKFENKSNILFEKIDISSTESIQLGFKNIFEKHKKIDILINNAVYSKTANPEMLSDEEWNVGIDGTLSSVFKCIREIIPYFKQNNSGKIINISSMYGMVAPDFKIYEKSERFLNPANYGASKAGVIQLTKYYASYLAKYNINVNCISPGTFPSEFLQQDEVFINQLCGKNPMNRIGKPEELKGVVVLLASDSSSYITGQNIAVDGGWTCI